MVRIPCSARARFCWVLSTLVVAVCAATPAAAQTEPGPVSLISRRYEDSLAGNGNSNWASVSADGRWVTFESSASNLAVGDTNARGDIFLRSLETGTTIRLTFGSQSSAAPAISPNGRFVAFTSSAPDLVADDTNNVADVFLYDMQFDLLNRVSVDSADGQANGPSRSPSVASNGTVAFVSSATNLVPFDGNGFDDVFIHQLDGSGTMRVSRSTVGGIPNGLSAEPAINAGATHVVYYSAATNLVPGDTNARRDVFLWDVAAQTTELVSRSTTDGPANNDSYTPAVTADGRYVAFTSRAANLVPGDVNAFFDVFVRDRVLGQTELVSVGPNGAAANDNASGRISISDDGRFVTFSSAASNLVPGDANAFSDVFVRDRSKQLTTRVSMASDGTEATGSSTSASISAGGRYVVFTSNAPLVPSDQNGSQADVYLVEGGLTGF